MKMNRKVLAIACLVLSTASCGNSTDSTLTESVSVVTDSGTSETSSNTEAAANADVVVSETSIQPDAVDATVTETSVVETSVGPDVMVSPETGTDVVDTGVGETEPVGCVAGTMACDGKTPKVCNANKTWDVKPDCQFLCDNGLCKGECNPGTEQCLTTNVQFCDATGTWQTTKTCPVNCQQNICPMTWCCKGNDSGCGCSINQICTALTGTLQTCPVQTYKCCYTELWGQCSCENEHTDCAGYVEQLKIYGSPNAKQVANCPMP
jgi:hypothetical protein